MIYFIQAGGGTGPVKIGLANDPRQRLTELQIGNHESLVLIGTAEGAREDELALHARFKDQRVRGEWFQWSVEIAIAARGGSGDDLTLPEAWQLTGLRTATLRRLMKMGEIDGYMAAGQLRLRTASLDAYMVKACGSGLIAKQTQPDATGTTEKQKNDTGQG